MSGSNSVNNHIYKIGAVLGLFILLCPETVRAESNMAKLLELDIAKLANINVEVSIASKRAEKISEAPGIISVITDDEIRKYGDSSLAEVLNRMPSFHVLNTWSFTNSYISSRAQSFSHYDNHTLLLLNGRQIRDSVAGGLNQVIYNTFPIESIKRVEVFRGPGFPLYGSNAFSAVVNVITKDASDVKGIDTSIRYGSSNYKDINISGSYINKDNDFDIYAAGRVSHHDGADLKYVDELGNYSEPNLGLGTYSTLLNAQYKKFTFNGLVTRLDDQALGNLVTGSGVHLEADKSFFDVGYTHSFSDKLEMQANTSLSRLYWNRSSAEASVAHSYETFSEVSFSYTPIDDVYVLVGSSYEDTNGEVTGSTYNHYTYGGYFQVDYRPIKQLKLLAAGASYKSDTTSSGFVPRVGLVYNYNDNLGAKLFYAEAFRSGTALETDFLSPALTGNSTLKPERIASYDAQVFYNTDSSTISLTYFDSKITDIIERIANPSPGAAFTYTNGGEVYSSGIEIEGRWQINHQWGITGSATFQNNKDESGNVDVTFDSNTMVKMGITYDSLKGIHGSIFNSYFGDTARLEQNNSNTNVVNPAGGNDHMLSANVEFDLQKLSHGMVHDMDLSVHGTNLLNKDVYYPEFTRKIVNTIPHTSGRLLYINIRKSF